ncbi:MAG: ABC transporter permease [Gemmatimonadaceae bacterium]
MSRLLALRHRLRALLRPGAHARELAEELRFHEELDAMHRRHAGASADAARLAARRRLGNATRITEEVREMSARHRLDELQQDLRYAARTLRRAPGFTVGAVLTLGLGIGAAAAMFTVVDAVLLRALPYADPERLVAVWTAGTSGGEPMTSSPPDFRELAAARRTFSGMAAHYTVEVNVAGGGEPERVSGARVSPSLFDVLGVAPSLGRAFAEVEGDWGRHRVAVISDGLWRRRFGADPRVIGRTITLDREPHVVVGVAPRALAFPARGLDVWLPIAFAPGDHSNTRGNYFLQIVARLRGGASAAGAAAELRPIARRVAAEHADAVMKDVVVRPLRSDVVGGAARPLLVLGGAIALVLLVSCANVAALVLARGSARRAEIALRAGLGASRARIVRQLMTESLVLGALAGVLGTALAAAGVLLAVRHAPPDLPRLQEVAVGARTLTVCAALALATTVLFGLVPALRLARAGVADALRERTRTATGRAGYRGYAALVAAQMALSVVLLAGAGLLLRSFARVMAVDPGFRAERVLSMAVALPEGAYPTAERTAQFLDAVLERARALPGVRAAAATSGLSLGGGWWGKMLSVAGRPAPRTMGEVPSVGYRVVSRDYFATLGVALRSGRTFGPDDRRGGPGVAVINETAARRFWGGESPLGKTIWLGPPEAMVSGHVPGGYHFPRLEVVGVVGDERFSALDEPPVAEVYQLYEQVTETASVMYLAVRADGDPAALAASVRAAVRAVDPLQPVADVATMSARLERATGARRFTLGLLGGFAALALGLAAVGLYGVIAYTVAERRRELAVRLALGDTAAGVVRLVVGRAMRPVVLGVAAGVAPALALAGVVRALLYGVSPTDPAAFAGAVVTLLAAALAASALPAWRASRLGLAETLRGE